MTELRHLTIRTIGWVAGVCASLFAVIVLILAVYVLFFDYTEHLKALMERETSRVLDREVSIDRIELNIPNSIELYGVYAYPAKTGGLPWLEIKSLRGEIKLTGLIRRQVQFSLLHVGGLVLRIQDYGRGQIDLPRLGSRVETELGRSDISRVGFGADRIRFDGANFVYNNHNLPWQLEANELRIQLDRKASDRYLGLVTYDQGELKIKDRPPFDGSLEARLQLSGKTLQLEDIKATGSFYEIRGKGDIQWGRELRTELRLEAESKIGPAARSILGLPLLTDASVASNATFEGHFSAGRGWHLLRGRLDVPEARFAGIPLRGWGGDLFWDRSVLELENAKGGFGGGPTELRYRQMLPVATHAAQLDVLFRGVSLQEIILGRTGFRGPLGSSIDGTVHLEIPAGATSRLSGAFELVGTAQEPQPQDMEEADFAGVALEIRGELMEGGLSITSGSFNTDSVAATLAGAYPGRGSAELNLELDVKDMAAADRLQRKLRTILRPEIPARMLQVAGQGHAMGRMEGRFPNLAFEGRFRGSEILFRGVPLGKVEGQGRLGLERLQFDAFRAVNRDAKIEARGELTLGPVPKDFEFHGRVDNWNASDIFRLLTVPWKVDGRLFAQGDVTARASRWIGEGSLSLSSGAWYGVPFDSVHAESRFLGEQVQIDSLRVSRGDASLEGRIRVDIPTKKLEGSMAARDVPLSEIFGEPLDLGGSLGGKLSFAGTLTAPRVEMVAHVPEVRLEGTLLGAGRLDALINDDTVSGAVSIKGPELELEARSQMELSSANRVTGDLRWKRADLAPWIRAYRSGLPGSLRVISDGEASFSGLRPQVESWNAEATLTDLDAEIGGYRLDSNGPVALRLENGSIEVEGFHLSGEGTEVQIHGTLPAAGGNLDIRSRGAVNLEILQSFYPSIASSGRVDLSARIRGDWDHPQLSGFADLSSGVFRAQGFPQAFGDVQGRILFDNLTIRAPDVQARFGGAPVGLSGTLKLRGLDPDSFEVSAVGRGMRIRYPEGLVATVNADLQLNGSMRSQLLSGRIVVEDAQWSREYDLATGILISEDSPGFELIDPADQEKSFANLRLDLEIRAPGTLRVKNSRAAIDAGAELQLRGTFARPALLGRAEAHRGELFLLGQKYNLISGKVEFVDPTKVQPFFDVVAESRVRSYRIELRLTGTPDRFFPELSSDPPLRTVDIMRLLAGASERDVLIGSEEEEIAGVGVASLLTERLSQEVGRRAERLFGLDRFSIDPFLVGKFANPTARVSIGKQIYRDLSVSYSTNLNETTETLILIEYTPEGPISWIFSRDEEGSLGVDLRFRKSF